MKGITLELPERSGSPALLVLLVFQKFLKRKAPALHQHFSYPSKEYTPAFVSVAMEKKNSGCWEPPKKKGLSFSIEEILKSEEVRLDGKGGGEAGQAAAADTEVERPSQDQAPGKCLSGSFFSTPGFLRHIWALFQERMLPSKRREMPNFKLADARLVDLKVFLIV